MKYKDGGRIALANINKNTLTNEIKFDITIMEEYKYLIPTPSSKAFSNDIGLCFNEKEFISPLEFIGSGFFADVYQVRHSIGDTLMAFKVPKTTESMCRFMKEIQLLKHLDHVNILGFHGTCVIDGLFGYLTEYLDSGNLSSLIEHHGANLEWPTGVRIAGDISNGLAYLHQQHIIHRDLSSENILLQKKIGKCALNNPSAVKYKAVIADFGLFLNLKLKRSDSMATVGNPFYTAPENLKNQTPYNFASDVFSFGLILCEIITGLKNDPNLIPRTDNYGINYKELGVKKDCPKWLQTLACDCCMMYVSNRPSMRRASEIIAVNKKYIKLWHSAPVPEEPGLKLNYSLSCMKMRTMSLSIQRPLPRDGFKGNKILGSNQTENESLSQTNGSTVTKSIDRPLCRFNSVDSFIDPGLVNLHKASNDPGYIDKPLTTSMRKLDPRRNMSTMHHLCRCCSESDLALRNLVIEKQRLTNQSPIIDEWSDTVFVGLSIVPPSP